MGTVQYKVILVDDSPDDRFFQKLILERNSKFIVAQEASDGQEAIETLQSKGEQLDLMLLDLKMPGKNGFDVLQWLQTSNLRKLTVAVLSGSWLAEDVTQSAALGAHAYFKKSSSREEQDKMIYDLEKLLKDRNRV